MCRICRIGRQFARWVQPYEVSRRTSGHGVISHPFRVVVYNCSTTYQIIAKIHNQPFLVYNGLVSIACLNHAGTTGIGWFLFIYWWINQQRPTILVLIGLPSKGGTCLSHASRTPRIEGHVPPGCRSRVHHSCA